MDPRSRGPVNATGNWLYCAARLIIGGILVIDDTQLWTGAVLRDFLLLESEWKLEASFAYGAAFRKIGEFRNKEWNGTTIRSRAQRAISLDSAVSAAVQTVSTEALNL